MFTNWLTGPSSSSVASVGLGGGGPGGGGGDGETGSSGSSVAVAATAAGIMSTPPDVVLEVGPAPSVRFVAHSIVLGMHSGYLRSAIRLDENAAIAAAAAASAELLLYLGNVTAEQFAPLLTYMYTGYLDLNVENIFGVLLATHVLHMPRALEICRSFLARAQTEGYLGTSAAAAAATAASSSSGGSLSGLASRAASGKIIRPIPSKATLPHFAFMPASGAAPPQLHTLQPAPSATTTTAMPPTSYKSLQQAYAEHAAAMAAADADDCERREHIDVERTSNKDETTRCGVDNGYGDGDGDDGDGIDGDGEDEEVEVFIDSNSETDVDAADDCAISVTSRGSWPPPPPLPLPPQPLRAPLEESHAIATPAVAPKLAQAKTEASASSSSKRSTATARSTATRSVAHSSKATKRERRKPPQTQRHKATAATAATTTSSTSSSATTAGLQVARAPIPASQLLDSASERSKVIIDVASCDGPVRFRRILNTAYGHKPDAFGAAHPPPPERSQQSVSLSFHQQMARTISQQRQLQHADESENSESSGGTQAQATTAPAAGGGKTTGGGGKHASNEIYVCVYCKHTFKSQYCYQKHAKRHLNPLNLNCATSGVGGGGGGGGVGGAAEHSHGHDVVAASGEKHAAAVTMVAGAAVRAHTLPLPTMPQQQHQQQSVIVAAELLRREVRPLDMNVQYYPCKTCGSKFPSYYFVHKHRKMCHADEEAASEGSRATAGGAATTTTGGGIATGGGGIATGGSGGEGSAEGAAPNMTEGDADHKKATPHHRDGAI